MFLIAGLTGSVTLCAFVLFLPLAVSFVVNSASLSFQIGHARRSACGVTVMCDTSNDGLTELRELQRVKGGIVGDVSYDQDHTCKDVLVSGFEAGLPAGFRAEQVDQALRSRALLVDKSHYGIIRVEGDDRMRFLHSQGTNAFEGAKEGAVISTCFTTNMGRVVDFCEAVVFQDEVWLLSSPHRWKRLLETMDKFIFPMDKTTVSSLSEQTAVFYLAGPQAAKALSLAGCDNTPARGHAMEWEFEDQKVIVFGHERSTATATKREGVPVVANSDGVTEAEEGLVTEYSVLLPCAVSAKLWSALSGLPAVVIAGEAEWQHLRIKNGLPFPGKELTNDYNPLEAGLWHTVHFDKGCYIGQESISRVNAYNAVKTVLYGISFEVGGQVHEGDALVAEEDGARAGVVTSLLKPEEGVETQGLAYIRTQAGGVGLKVLTKDGGVRGTVIEVPYPTRSDAESAQPPVKKQEEAEAAAIYLEAEDEKAKEAARKAAKLEAMQKKLDALKARRKTT